MNSNQETNNNSQDQALERKCTEAQLALSSFFLNRGNLCFVSENSEHASCLGFYFEPPVGAFTLSEIATSDQTLSISATLVHLTPSPVIPVMQRFVELINHRLPRGRMQLSSSGSLQFTCSVQPPVPGQPWDRALVVEHTAYTCRMFYLLYGLIDAIHFGALDESGLLEAINDTWPTVEMLLPHLAKDELLENVLLDLDS
ncbi:MAG: hypothetical protein RMK20_08515 [Verrucomicrobiales bacterium]|nr:hypothetical protein [Verrucomicrobiales bacterium]